MEKPICKDPIFLSRKALPADPSDASLGQDLLDTLHIHREHCVGMAANMIGVLKRIIAVDCEGETLVMLNPEIIKASGAYQTEEACLSLAGRRPTTRYKSIKVRWQTEQLQTRIKTFSGWCAQIIQHEIDQCNGILI